MEILKRKKSEYRKIEEALNRIHILHSFNDGLYGSPQNDIDRVALFLKLQDQFGDILSSKQIQSKALRFLQRKAEIQREEEARKQKEELERKRIENEPIRRLIKILRSNLHIVEPAMLEEWKRSTTIKQKEATLKEFKELMSKRGLPLTVEQQTFGLTWLQNVVFHEQMRMQKPKQNNGLLTKLKGLILNERS